VDEAETPPEPSAVFPPPPEPSGQTRPAPTGEGSGEPVEQVEAQPAPSRAVPIAVVAGIVVVALAVGLLLIFRGPGSKTFGKHGVSFEYPGGWKEITDLTFQSHVGSATTSDGVGPDTQSFVILATYRINSPIGPSNIDDFRQSVVDAIRQVAQGAGGTIVAGPARVTMDGLPGYRFEIRGKNAAGTAIGSRVVLVFHGQTEYFLNCQHTDSRAAEIENGCDQIMRTFNVSSAS
jgi:hypothetical protein